MRDSLVEQILRLPVRTRNDVVRRLVVGQRPAEVGDGAPRVGRFPANPGQRRLWFLWQVAPSSSAYHIALHYDLRGPLDHQVLAEALDDVRTRHEVLRTTFEQEADVVHQVVGPPRPTSVLLRTGPPEHELDEFSAQPFDLRAGPLLRARAWRLAPDHHLLAFVFHHIVFDEHSVEVFERELTACYAARLAGEPVRLPALPAQCADLDEPVTTDGLARWVRRLDGAVPTELPADRPRPAVASFHGAVHAFEAPAPARDQVVELARRSDTTPFVVLFAALCVFLARQTGRDDISVGTPVACRNRRETRDLIGFFVNTVVLRANVDRRGTFRDLVAVVRNAALDSFRAQDVPFDEVVRAVGARVDSARNPLFRVMFAHAQHTAGGSALRIGGVGAHPRVPTTDEAAFDLTVSSALEESGLRFAFEYATDLYEPATVEHWATALGELVVGLTGDPDAPVADSMVATSDERARIAIGNTTARPTVDVMVPELFRGQASRTPDASAVDDGGRVLSYHELDARVDALAARLRELGADRERIVAICLPNGVDAVVAMLAAWRAGAAFAPLDPAHPRQRNAALLDGLLPVAVVAEPDPDPGFPERFPVVSPRCAAPPEPCPVVTVRPDQLAYVIHTSGSTGQPKGVLVEHGSLANHAVHQLRPLLSAAGDRLRVGLGASVVFDVFVNQLLPLAFGHTIVVLDEEQRLDPRRIAALGGTPRALDVLDYPPAQLPMLIDTGLLDSATPPKLILFGGESCPPQAWHELRARPHVSAYNCYGPTECTIDATLADVRFSAVPTVGVPHGNATVHVLDERSRPVPVGAVGEIHIGGAGVGRGYLGHPGLTAASFVPDPGRPGARLYRTGDLGRLRADGRLEFWGRRDDQVKIRGRRIELAEIESAVLALPGVRQAAVVLRTPDGQDGRIAAYVVPEAGTRPDPSALRTTLLRRLPDYLVPVEFVTVSEFSLNSSGKIDRTMLPEPSEQDRAVERVRPRSPREHLVAGVWSEVLGATAVGVFDDFFDIGGHSLLAVRLAALLESRVGRPVPLSLVLAAPTVAAQATALDAGAMTHQHLLPLGGQGPPLVLVHPIGGLVFCYRELAAGLSEGFEVFGLQAEVAAPMDGLAMLTETYARILAERFPEQAPVLVGWSAGGVLAHEVACALDRLGHPVRQLVLVDSVPEESPAPQLGEDVEELDRLRAALRVDGARPEHVLACPTVADLFATLGVDQAGLVELPAASRDTLFSFWRAMIVAVAEHRPGVFRGRAVLLLADTHDAATTDWLCAKWARAVDGPVAVHRIDGGHFDLLTGAAAADIARVLRTASDTDSTGLGGQVMTR